MPQIPEDKLIWEEYQDRSIVYEIPGAKMIKWKGSIANNRFSIKFDNNIVESLISANLLNLIVNKSNRVNQYFKYRFDPSNRIISSLFDTFESSALNTSYLFFNFDPLNDCWFVEDNCKAFFNGPVKDMIQASLEYKKSLENKHNLGLDV